MEWRRLELLKVERELLLARVAELVELVEDLGGELAFERDHSAALEAEVLDLTSDLAAARLELAHARL